MKIAMVVLMMVNWNGGAPVEVAKFYTMDECNKSIREVSSYPRSFGSGGAVLYCVPLYRVKS